MLELLPLVVALSTCIVAAPAQAGWDAFSDQRFPPRFTLIGADGLRLQIKGRGELSVRDLEGAGGDGKDSTTDTVTLGTRSPAFRLDRAQLALRLFLDELGLSFLTEFTFTDREARARSVWLDYAGEWGDWAVHAELGLNSPFIAVDDNTFREPLTSRIYWGRREMHATAEVSHRVGRFQWTAGLSAGLMRPVSTVTVNDATRRSTLSVIGAADAEPFAGNAPVFGARGVLDLYGVRLWGFGFVGSLGEEQGYGELRNRIANYSLLPGFNTNNPRQQDRTFWWAGGRLEYVDPDGLEVRLEAIESQESLLRRRSGYAQLGYVFVRDPDPMAIFRTFELRVRGEYYRIAGAQDSLGGGRSLRAVDPSQALTWDWNILTLAFQTRIYGEVLRMYIEYSWIGERNDAPDVGQDQQSFRNNEFVMQVELRF